MSGALRALVGSLVALLLTACGGGGGGPGASGCTGDCAAVPQAPMLTTSDVERIIAQAAFEAAARRAPATIAVVDRVGNVLGVFRMASASASFRVASGRTSNGIAIVNGLDGLPEGVLPASLAAISKAVTGAYLSSEGNAFSTRTASQIVQEQFNPRESQSPSGPLYGVQFSQFICSDLIQSAGLGAASAQRGPKPSPLGLSADPGGLPLYKNGTVVGGVGVISDALYSLDLDVQDIDQDNDELIAVAGARGFDAPTDRRADRITADGRTFRYVDSEQLASDPARAPPLAAVVGGFVEVPTYFSPALVRSGVAFRTAAAGMRLDTGAFSAQGAVVLVDAADSNRYPPRAGLDALPQNASLTQIEVTTVMREALTIANRTRAQIRRPLGSAAEVTVSIVDSEGHILALARTRDAPLFGTDVSLQKARGALLFSHPAAASRLTRLPSARSLLPLPPGVTIGNLVERYAANSPPFPSVTFGESVAVFRSFVSDPSALTGNVAYTTRSVGNLHRPTFPDGIDASGAGPLSTSIERWSPFALGFQLDLVYNQFIKGVAVGDTSVGCAGRAAATDTVNDDGLSLARNGIQIFPGSVPLYRGHTLVGAVGVSGDGVDQDDMIAFLGVANAARALNGSIGNAPAGMRADGVSPRGARLRYVQCPQAPFNGSSEQNVCVGL